MSAAALLRATLVIGGLAAIVASLGPLLLGIASIPGGMPVNATLDSEARFYACFFCAYGVLALWCARRLGQRLAVVPWLALVLFAGGVARLLAIAASGWPHPFFVAMTGVELVVPLLLWACAWRLRGSGSSR